MHLLVRCAVAFLSIAMAGALSSFRPFDPLTFPDTSPFPILVEVLNQDMIPTFDDTLSQPLIHADRAIGTQPLTLPNLILHEGRRHRAYTDSTGHLTIGIGSNLDAPDAPGKIRAIGASYNRIRAGLDQLSSLQIDKLFDIDLRTAIEAAHRLVPHFEDRPFPVQCVVIDLCFNLGATGFAGLRTFRAALNRYDYTGAARALTHTTWYEQVGTRAEDVIKTLQLGTTK